MSDRKSIQQEIGNLSERIRALNEDMLQRNDLSVLDIDLLRKHTIDLYESVNQLRLVMKESVEHTVVKRSEERKVENEERGAESGEREVVKRNEEPETESEKVEARVVEHEPVEEPLPQAPVTVTTETLVTETVVQEVSVQDPVTHETVSEETSTTITETSSIEKTRMNDPVEEPSDLASRFSNTPIHDLKRAISIAKKFEYINSLFGGNVEKYAYAIHRINNLNSGDEAFTYLHELKAEHKWDEEDSNFIELANMVRRRYLG